ncbi:MAB_1171c family putative transporter [Nocardioides sp.]|uniref:MAB_1171c family putative transporter n=1 Tax=Nocardioides sp. TaxID=35761 RepID=UPI003D09899A
MIDLLFYSVAALAAATAVQRVIRARKTGQSAPSVLPLAALACALVFISSATQAVVSLLIPSLGRLLSNLCTMLAAFGFVRMQLLVRLSPDEVRRRLRGRLVILAAVMLVLIVSFTLGRRPAGIGVFDYRGQPWLVVYALVYSIYFSLAIVDLMRVTAQAMGKARGVLRAGVVLMTVGYLCALVYAGSKVQFVVRTMLGPVAMEPPCTGPFSTPVCTLSVGLPAVAILFIVMGLAVAPIARWASRCRGWVTNRQLYTGLEPLWQALYTTMPQIALTAPGGVDGRVPAYDVDLRLYRRIVEIRDGVLILRPYRCETDTAAHRERGLALGLTGERLDAEVESADLAVALSRYRDRRQPDPGGSLPDERVMADDLRREAAWLVAVSRAFQAQTIRPVEERVG